MRRAQLLLACLLSVFAAAALAQKGNPQAGEFKATPCMGCHGIPGYFTVYPTYHVPKVGGQNAEYILAALKDYRDGKRQFPTMQAQARSLTEQDMADIAAFFESVGKEGK